MSDNEILLRNFASTIAQYILAEQGIIYDLTLPQVKAKLNDLERQILERMKTPEAL